MDPGLRRAWTQIVASEDYDEHMARIGQAQAGADLTCQIIRVRHGTRRQPRRDRGRRPSAGARFRGPRAAPAVPPHLHRPEPGVSARLTRRLVRHGLAATVLEDDIEQTALEPAPDLLLATLLLEHIDWRRGVEAIAGLIPPREPARDRVPPALRRTVRGRPADVAKRDPSAGLRHRTSPRGGDVPGSGAHRLGPEGRLRADPLHAERATGGPHTHIAGSPYDHQLFKGDWLLYGRIRDGKLEFEGLFTFGK